MIRAILFVLLFILLAIAIGFAIWGFCIWAKAKNEVDDDQKQLERELRQIRDKYQDKVWRLNSSSPKFLEEKANLEAQMKAEQEEATRNWETPKIKGKVPFIVCVALALGSLGFVITLPGSVHQVDTGSVAVIRHLGKITGMRNPGTYVDFYMVNHYEIYDTKVQQDKIVTAAYSKDGQTMELEVFLQYQVQPEHIMDIATQYGSLEALQSRIETQTIEKTKAVMSSDIAMNIIQKRAEFSANVSEAVREGISADYYVNVKDVVLTNIDFTDEFERSVEAKVIAEQEKQAAITRAEGELEVAKLEAQKKIEEARGNAEAQKIIAKASAEAATYNIIELARTVGYTVNETYIYSVDGLETEFDVRQVETETVIYLGTKYVIDTTSGPGPDKFKSLVEDYLAYLEYLKVWNGELPNVVAGDDAISIIVPNN